MSSKENEASSASEGPLLGDPLPDGAGSAGVGRGGGARNGSHRAALGWAPAAGQQHQHQGGRGTGAPDQAGPTRHDVNGSRSTPAGGDVRTSDGYSSLVKWTWVLALGALAGGVVWAAYRRNQQELADAALWAEATDPVVRHGENG